MSRRKAREFAFKVLFQVELVNAEPWQAFNYLIQNTGLAEKDHDFAWELIQESIDKLPAIDDKIKTYAQDWSLERMPTVDRNIMRIAVCELLFMHSVDAAIIIDEAIEIAKKYGGAESPAYINAILDRIRGEKP